MAKTLIDIVNFNSDASCLYSESWLSFLSGGKQSYFYRWLELYVQQKKNIVLGLTGATICDVKAFNPEAIELINHNPEIFEIILRPFSHDIALYRSNDGFNTNLDTGIQLIRQEFQNVNDFFLPPEFMLKSCHIKALANRNIKGCFIYASRYAPDIRSRIPEHPYTVTGVQDSNLNCIPIERGIANIYLESIQLYDDNRWNRFILRNNKETIFSWRDGESIFLIPDGLERENFWLDTESPQIKRCMLKQIDITFKESSDLHPQQLHGYPIQSFLAWAREMKMLWFVEEVKQIEDQINSLNSFQISVWLQLINSDILAAVEKISPQISIKKVKDSSEIDSHIIYRSERGLEGENCLLAFYEGIEALNTITMKKYYYRIKFLEKFLEKGKTKYAGF